MKISIKLGNLSGAALLGHESRCITVKIPLAMHIKTYQAVVASPLTRLHCFN
jgi:hypothetical protein